MPKEDLERHAAQRHPLLRFVTCNEHDALHRLQGPAGHVHTNMLEPRKPMSGLTSPEPVANADAAPLG